ncbi:hypothetical protein MBEHAL_1553 [Halarchaeum acidiphilum MH1-52-1]|uniref:Uncharacterized protein n=1 Tax=Halarchaeum acidiphilum MH1-52-1 TaxID=1261545 RepID=U3ADD9_9EURY|nr:hypothetical protein MBEHAL_1553 [Halarchaeum acidiphilum MH1-52-1]
MFERHDRVYVGDVVVHHDGRRGDVPESIREDVGRKDRSDGLVDAEP